MHEKKPPPKPRRWRKGDKLGFGTCVVCRAEITANIIEAMYPGLVIVRSWCTKQEIWVYGVNVPPDFGIDTATVAFTEPL